MPDNPELTAVNVSTAMLIPPVAGNHQARGIALVIVTALLAMVTLLVVAMLTLAQSESRTATSYAESLHAQRLNDTAVALVIEQIRSATRDEEGAETWASQPGALRRFAGDGSVTGYKLYSDPDMVVGRAEELIGDVPVEDWDQKPGQWVDMNQPVIRLDPNSVDPLVFYPVADPRSMVDDPDTVRNEAVEGFAYSKQMITGQELALVVTPGDVDLEAGGASELRLPMPVEWIYVLRDGTLGTLSEEGLFLPATGGQAATPQNPIRGRIAFWTDDENSKLNVNTASVGTSWLEPMVTHEVTAKWAGSQPMHREYGRFPGHPAQVSLGPVLVPGVGLHFLDHLNSGGPQDDPRVALKEELYDLIPRLQRGGSLAGTEPLSAMVELSEQGTFEDTAAAKRERLYATLDELLFTPAVGALGDSPWDVRRIENPLGTLLEMTEENRVDGQNAAVIERSRFFLTANSRGSEMNMLGLPRIAVWPVDARENTGAAEYRTDFDEVLAFIATLNEQRYHFVREEADQADEDVAEKRNAALLDYLDQLASIDLPGFGGNFRDKYGADETRQILLEIFDYIRATNLQDGVLAEAIAVETARYADMITGDPVREGNAFTDPGALWTEGGLGREGLLAGMGVPGQGQVVPTHREGEAGIGLGRFETISEVAFHVIASADTGEKAEFEMGGVGESNFPPLDGDAKDQLEQAAESNQGGAGIPKFEELNAEAVKKAIRPELWNFCLEINEPLPENTKRLQGVLLLETFSAMAGFTPLSGDYFIKVTGLDSFEVNGTPAEGEKLFPEDEVIIQSSRPSGAYEGGNPLGGTAGFKGLLAGRSAGERIPLSAGPGRALHRGSAAGAWDPDGDLEPDGFLTWPLVTNFFDVSRDGQLEFSSGTLTIEIYANAAYANGVADDLDPGGLSPLVQTIEVTFPSGQVELPEIVIAANGPPSEQPADLPLDAEGLPNPALVAQTHSQFWWCFHRSGCARTSSGKLIPGRLAAAGQAATSLLFGEDAALISGGSFLHPEADVVQSLVPIHGDYRLVAATRLVPDTVFVPSRQYGEERYAHQLLTGLDVSASPGFDLDDTGNESLVPSATPSPARAPDFPRHEISLEAAHKHGDFDNGIADLPEGAYANKADDGAGWPGERYVPYLDRPEINLEQRDLGSGFWSPQRLMPSAGMFGSLPTGVISGDAWQTLLFRPQGWSDHPGDESPRDHLFLDFFWMPKLAPYPLSEPGSTAGQVNLNYQILPFTHVRRATALHGLLASETVQAFPVAAAGRHLVGEEGETGSEYAETVTQEGNPWFHKIDVEATLAQFEDRFRTGGIFVTASQLCDQHLVPQVPGSAGLVGSGTGAVDAFMKEFWTTHALTGDNVRERPYANLYGLTTTRSNVYRIHVRAQALRVPPGRFDRFNPQRDRVLSEYRGETVIERHLDPDDERIPDYAQGDPLAEPNLDSLHRFRILSTQRFSP